MSPEEKSLASRCSAAEYTIAMCLDHAKAENEGFLDTLLKNPNGEDFLSQPSIIVTKKSMKHKNPVEVDIRPMIHFMNICVIDNNMFITTELAAGSSQNLSPELLIEALMDFYGFRIPRETIEVLRTEVML